MDESQIETRNPSSSEDICARSDSKYGSNRKRIKIFNTKSHQCLPDDGNSFGNGIDRQLFQNDTFAQPQTQSANTSSAIMAEDSNLNVSQPTVERK